MNDWPHQNENPSLSDEQLAELERASEKHGTLIENISGDDISEFQQCYSLIESLTSPIRSVLVESSDLPFLPDYEDLQEIGRGGMGIVYRGRHKKTRRIDAIKVIRQDCVSDDADDHQRELQHLLLQEAKLAARVAHEHIVPVYQVGEIDGAPWFSMQLVEGKSLRELIQDAPMAPEKSVRVMEQIARAVDKVHRHGILHGDIKPHNILIETEGERPLITDFGLADVIETTRVAQGIAGTPAYMAPELAEAALEQRSPEEVAEVRSVACDIYSLGATLWSLVTGLSPCEDNLSPKQKLEAVASGQLRTNQARHSKIPPDILRICQQSMMRYPQDRHATAGEFADALSQWLNRPRWNQFFPGLRSLLQVVVAPTLFLSGLLVWWLMQGGVHEAWIWLMILSVYPPLFLSFAMSQQQARSAERARRELWSIWLGHLVGTLACLMSLRILCHPDRGLAFTLFYSVWAGISSVVFFSKSGNFWSCYRWIGAGWAVLAVVLAMTPSLSSILFGAAAAMTCLLIARGDTEFQED